MTVLMDPEKRELWKACLGVLVDLYRKETGNGEWLPPNSEKRHWAFHEENHEENDADDAMADLPVTVCKWAGIPTQDGVWRRGKVEAGQTLAWENDRGKTFAEIAELL